MRMFGAKNGANVLVSPWACDPNDIGKLAVGDGDEKESNSPGGSEPLGKGWHQWVIVWNNTNDKYTIWKDAQKFFNGTIPSSFGALDYAGDNNFIFNGIQRDSGGNQDEGFDGQMDELYMWNRTLNESEITFSFNNPNATLGGSSGGGGGGGGGNATSSETSKGRAWETVTPITATRSEQFCLVGQRNETFSTFNVSFHDSYPSLDQNRSPRELDLSDSRCASIDLRGHGNQHIWLNVTNSTGESLDGVWWIENDDEPAPLTLGGFNGEDTSLILLSLTTLFIFARLGWLVPILASLLTVPMPIFEAVGVPYPWSFPAYVLLTVVGIGLRLARNRFRGDKE